MMTTRVSFNYCFGAFGSPGMAILLRKEAKLGNLEEQAIRTVQTNTKCCGKVAY